MLVYTVDHVTTYRYRRALRFGAHRMLFRPRDSYDQKLIDATLDITPAPADIRWHHDVFGNCVAVATFDARADTLSFASRITLDQARAQALRLAIEDDARHWPFAYDPAERLDLAPAIARAYPDEGEVERWFRRFLRTGKTTPTGRLLMTATAAVKDSFVYERRTEKGTQPPTLTLKRGRGTCRDFALLMMEGVRSLGFAARFVTGYLYVPERDAEARLGGGSTHAWCQVYLPGAGWVEFDPTNGLVGSPDLIRVAVARDPSQAIPLSGSYIGRADDHLGMTVSVQVRRNGPADSHPIAMAS